MNREQIIYTAPPGTGEAVLGKTLPDLLYEACARYENPRFLNQPIGETWKPVSLDDFRRQAEETALGLLDLGLVRGEHVAFYMESDVFFCIADMGCLLAGLIDVPIYLTHALDAVQYVIEHAEARAVFVSNRQRLLEIAPVLEHTRDVRLVVVAESYEGETPAVRDDVVVCTLDEVRARGSARLADQPDAVRKLRDQIDPGDLATIIYTSGTTGKPKGVMLSHENISYNAMTSFSGLSGYHPGPSKEIAISFLPLTHIFARALHYGFVAHGTTVYFTEPENLAGALLKVRPTVFATVPRVLEKVYTRIQERTASLTGFKRRLGSWALELARSYELGKTPPPWMRLQLKVADALVYRKWREAIGGRVRYIISGGAALNAEIANVFAAAGVTVLQGYGLTETSPVITYNRPNRNRAGTVGEPLPGLEVTLAEDGEILTRGPHVMLGYYKDPEKTRAVIDADGWFHTGDVGEITSEGFLRITDRKKDLFKLSTGKYVMPQPLENRLVLDSLVEHAVVVGIGRKYCTALIFPDQDAVRNHARSLGLDAERPVEELLREPRIRAHFQHLVEEANEGMDPWSTIKRFALVPEHLTIENGMLTPTLKVRRSRVHEHYRDKIDALYDDTEEQAERVVVS